MPDISKMKIGGIEYDIKDATARENAGSSVGNDGGYYTPSVVQLDASTMRISYTPSDSAMTTVPEVDVILPAGADGTAPHIGDNGNWWIGDEDTGVAASGSASVSVDTTLSKEGQPADAKAVGDRFSLFSEEIAADIPAAVNAYLNANPVGEPSALELATIDTVCSMMDKEG